MNKPLAFRLQTLSPIHIGCDEIYEPTAFVVDEKNLRLTTFDPLHFLKTLDEKDKRSFFEICRKGTTSSILEIYKFMRRRTCEGRQIEICPGFVDNYRKTLSIPLNDSRRIQQELSTFAIARTAFGGGDERPYVPGSAIKGTLRTAYLNFLAGVRKMPSPAGRSAAKDLEARLLDAFTIETDPFRLLKVSDFRPVGAINTRIIYAVNKKKKPSKFAAHGPHQILEVIEPGSVFEGTICVHEAVEGAGVKSALTMEALLASVRSFYSEQMTLERDDLTKIGVDSNCSPTPEGVSILRLGRHCGAECVTIEGHRNIKIMQAKGEKPLFEERATTVWLASELPELPKTGLRPFGWAAIEQMTPQMLVECDSVERDFRLDRMATPGNKSGGGTASVLGTMLPSAENPEPESASMEPSHREEWADAVLSWSPGNQVLTASFQGKKATCKGKDLVPEAIQAKLFGKKKTARTNLSVERQGNAYRIVHIEGNV